MGWFAMLCCAALAAGCTGMMVPEAVEMSAPTPAMKYYILGQKDAQGHWTEEVKMEHAEEDWHIEVDHLTVDVGEGPPKVKITATFSGKPKTLDKAEKGEKPDEADDTAETEKDFQIFPRSYRDWFGAQAMCEEWGGHLAIPNTEAKMKILTDILTKYIDFNGDFSSAFLGFNDQKDEGSFVTIFGKPVFRTQDSVWSPHWYRNDQPDDDKSWTKDGEDCGSLHPNGGLNDVPCRYSLPFICEKAKDDEVAGKEVVEGEIFREVGADEEKFYNEETSNADGLGEDEDEDTLHLFPRSYIDWFDAERACIEWGGHLAVPDSEEKVLKMTKMLASREMNPEQLCAFLGFDDQKTEGEFVTIFGKPVFNSNDSWSPHWFKPNQPDDDKAWTKAGEDCGSIHPNGGLNDVPCRYHLPYFCEKSKVQDLITVPTLVEDASDEGVPSNIEENLPNERLDSLTLFIRDDLTWFEANDACQEWGGNLATPDSIDKVVVMTIEMHQNDISAAFLGYGDQEEEGNFVTIYGTPVFSTSGWSPSWWRPNQPDDDKDWFADGEDCGSIKSSGGLNDVPCKHHLPFFCEKKPKPAEQEGTEKPDTGDNILDGNLSFESFRGFVFGDKDVNMDAKVKQGLQDFKNIAFVRDILIANAAESDIQAQELETKLDLDNDPSPMLVNETDESISDLDSEGY